MSDVRDPFCAGCGTRYPTTTWPRTCAGCGVTRWANPIPVVLALVPVVHEARLGLLVVRRAIEPRRGLLGLVGGFLEAHETWAEGAAREVREESGVVIDPATLSPSWFSSTSPRPDRVLLFAEAPPLSSSSLPPFRENGEATWRGIVRGPDGLDGLMAFSLHTEAMRRFFAARGITGEADILAL